MLLDLRLVKDGGGVGVSAQANVVTKGFVGVYRTHRVGLATQGPGQGD